MEYISGISGGENTVALIIISIAAMMLFAYLMTRITKKLKLPNVTAYILTGILLGPFCFNVVPEFVISGTEFLPDIALAFIAFSTGEFFKMSTLRKNGAKVVVITVFESLFASVLVFSVTFFALGLNLAFSAVLAALAAATAPASTVMTIRQTGAKGDFVDTLLQVVALDDVVGLVVYSIAISVALASFSGKSFSFGTLLAPLLKNAGVLLLGGGFGVIMRFMIQNRKSSDNRLIISVALIFAFCGICALTDISPLLGCMSMGTVYINMTEDEKLFRQLNYFSPPILLLFFVRSGMTFDLKALFQSGGSIGKSSLLLVGVLYFIVRIAGKYAGAYIGCRLCKKPPKTSNFLGLALIPQAGVAIGLAALGARTLGGEAGNALQTVILSSSVLYELAGPACAKLSLYLSGSYSNKIEEIVPLAEEEKAPLELLIERIQKIQEELPQKSRNEDEAAFTEAAEEAPDLANLLRMRAYNRRMR